MNSRWPILVVDDEEVVTESVAAWLREDGYTVDTASSGAEALAMAHARDYAIFFIDLKMPGEYDGLDTLREVRRLQPEASIVVITAYATVETAVAAMKDGAQEYLVKPCHPQEISRLVARSLELRKLQRENLILRKKLSRQYHFHDLISKSPRMLAVFDLIREVADLRSTVLIRGESGTGKELVARALHFSGKRASRPFVGVACGALAETLLESELFGHERGAFTGATERRKGKFELADGGTLFLDEIGDISPKLQVDLLRVLQLRRFFRVGGSEELPVDVRVVAATHRDLEEEIRGERFREDLFYRLNVITIQLPPLRERTEDVPLLAQAFLDRLTEELGKELEGFSEGALAALLDHDWPGNVRELENAIERAVVTCRGARIDEADLAFLRRPESRETLVRGDDLNLAELEKRAITAALARTGGNVTRAAAALGIDRSTLYDKLRKYEIVR
ncbi:MAG: sigma-54 dependent transcriptional regulator [Thermoanaerobaculia bacterium]|nr:sigma-54 dependent transcriptional regulator [Thermoanaerobaculia bacterium]MCZ7652723.1 sigma-54 dependent transcriptional regulator [Thermoanaerobaculia bacterium]